MNNISKESIEFLSEARKQFEEHSEYTTYRDVKGDFIALRNKNNGDVTVYRLGEPVGNFENILPKQIDYYSLWVRLRHEVVLLTLERMENESKEDTENPYNEIAKLMSKLEWGIN